jgi:hypothetical protein
LGMGTFVTEAGIVVEGNYGDEPTLLLWETWVNMFYTHMHMSETFWGVYGSTQIKMNSFNFVPG